MKIVHVGFPKTASTFLQWRVFPLLQGINYIDYRTCREVFQPIIYSDVLDYSIDEIKSALSQSTGNTLYSFESLTGSPFYYKGLGRSNIAKTLKKLGFDKVIITIRSQEKAIDSYYRQYVVQGGTLSFRNWLDIDNHRPLPQKYFHRGYLQYDKLVDVYASEFGRENILLLTQESLHEDQQSFIQKISQFTKTTYQTSEAKRKANESLSNLGISILRLVNHFTFSSVRPFHLISKRISNRLVWKIFAIILDPYLFRLFSSRSSYVSKYGLEKRIQEYYKGSNESLKKNWGIDFNN
ncbi:hypothetical protein SAMN05421640_3546 [Ekhidna lutea]|uniref:Sulfotransferase domain-containing protein n=1 Tax=Ekhidna lutea TaxID=447679 RepID=A0A239M079_EKHLU|nr:hypothetical protein [Ekhidna lutea]SNT36156.1 hypothetical protein SAMN05421640_3546 [Ekhidna lutea]